MLKATIVATALAFAFSGAAFAQNNGGGNQGKQKGLVNIQLGDVLIQEIAEDINVDVSQVPVQVQVPVSVAATICGVDVNVLAQEKSPGETVCEATSNSEALTQVVQQQLG